MQAHTLHAYILGAIIYLCTPGSFSQLLFSPRLLWLTKSEGYGVTNEGYFYAREWCREQIPGPVGTVARDLLPFTSCVEVICDLWLVALLVAWLPVSVMRKAYRLLNRLVSEFYKGSIVSNRTQMESFLFPSQQMALDACNMTLDQNPVKFLNVGKVRVSSGILNFFSLFCLSAS